MSHGPVVMAAEVPAYLGPTAALVLAAALVGYVSVRARVVPIVGFLLAGVLIGPAQLGLVSSTTTVEAAAEVGVILLLFTIGIEFSIERLARVWRWIVIGGGTQVLLATGAGLCLVVAFGGTWRVGVFTGFLIALSSTAIVLKLLADAGQTNTTRGRLVLSTLIFQDLAVVAMVLVVPLLGHDGSAGGAALAQALAVAAAVIGVVLLVARRVMPPLLERVAALCSPEVFLLAVVAICFGTAYLTALAGVSVSLGAFLAGLVVSESRHSIHAFAEVLPLQILFSSIFFVSVGMLLDVRFLLFNMPLVLAVALGVLALKTLTTTAALLPLGVGWRQAAAAGLMLSQVGEFSFVLLTVGEQNGLTPAGLGRDGSQTFVSTTVLLMVLTPTLAALGDQLFPKGARGATSPEDDATSPGASAVADHVLLLGWGQDSIELARDLHGRGVHVVMTTLNPGGAAAAERSGIQVVRGDSMRTHVLEEAGIATARMVVIAEDGPEQAARVATVVRSRTQVPIVVRTHGPPDLDALSAAQVDHVVDADAAARARLGQAVLEGLGIGGDESGHDTGSRTSADTTKLVSYRWPEDSGCPHGPAAHPVLATADGCLDCLREGLEWVHLRICLTCGNVGCCDSSVGQHAREHHTDCGHPLITSLELGETWGYCFLDATTVAHAQL